MGPVYPGPETQGIAERKGWILPALLLLVATTRLCVIFLFPRPFIGDMIVYENLAFSLLGGHGFAHGPNLPPTATQMPLFPLLVSGIYTVFGRSHLALYLVQTGIDIATAFVIYLAARRLFEGKRPAYVAVLLWAAYLPAAEFAASALTETLFTFLASLSIYATIAFVGKPRVGVLFLAGILMGLATFTRPFAFGFPVFLIPPLLFFLPRRRFTLVAFFAYLFGITAVLSPWTIRNYREFNEFIPTSTLGGVNLYKSVLHIGEDDYARPGSKMEFSPQVRSFLESTASEAEKDRFFIHESFKLIRAHPGRYVKLCFLKLARLWFNVGMSGPPSMKSLLFMAANLFLMAFAVAAVFSRRVLANALCWPMISFLLYITVFHMGSHALGRFSLPGVPALIVLASPGLVDVGHFLASRLNLGAHRA